MKENDEEVIEMRICEVPHLVLKANVLYRFTVADDCEACVKVAKDADDGE